MIRQWQDSTFDAEVGGTSLPVMIVFTRENCPSCQALLPILAELQKEMAGQVMIGSVDMILGKAIAERFAVRGTPLTMLWHKSKVRASFVGIRQKVELAAAIRNL